MFLLFHAVVVFLFSSRRRHTSCALVTGVQTCALPISSPYRVNKVRDLAHAVGAEKHLVAEDAGDSHYASLMEEGLNPDIFSRIAALRQRSDAYLDHVLNKGSPTRWAIAGQPEIGRAHV